MKKLDKKFVTMILLFLSLPIIIFTAQAPRVVPPTAARPTPQQLKSQIKINKELNEYTNSIKSGDFTKQDIILDFQKRIDDLKSYEQKGIKLNTEHPVKLAAYEKFVRDLQNSGSRLKISQTPEPPSELSLTPKTETSARPTAKPTQEISLPLAPAETILPEPKLTPQQEIDQIKKTYAKKFKDAQTENDRQAILQELKNNRDSELSSTINKRAYSEILAIVEPEQSAWQALGDIGLEITRSIAENFVPAVQATARTVQDSVVSHYIQPVAQAVSAASDAALSGATYLGTKALESEIGQSLQKQALNKAAQIAANTISSAAKSSMIEQPVTNETSLTPETTAVVNQAKANVMQAIKHHGKTVLNNAVSALDDNASQPADPNAKSFLDNVNDLFTPENQQKTIKFIQDFKTQVQDLAYPKAKAERDSQAKSEAFVVKKDTNATPLESDGKIPAKITTQYTKNLQKSLNRQASIKTSTADNLVSSEVMTTAQALRNNLITVPVFAKNIASFFARTMGLSKKETQVLDTDMQNEVKVLIRDKSSWFYATDAIFKYTFNSWMHKKTVKIFEKMGMDNYGDIKVATISTAKSDPAQASTQIIYNQKTGEPKSALISYDGQTYQGSIVKNTDGTFTITGDLLSKESNPSFVKKAFVNPQLKSIIDSINPKKSSAASSVTEPSIESAGANLIAESTLNQKSDGTISIIFNPKKPNEALQTIIKTQPDGQIKIDKDISSNPSGSHVTLTGKKGDRYLATADINFDANNNPTSFNIFHDLEFTTNGEKTITRFKPKPDNQTISYDTSTNTSTITALFNARDNENATLQSALKSFGGVVGDAAGIEFKRAVLAGEAMQDARHSNANLADILNLVQANATAKAPISVEAVVMQYNHATGQTTVKTVRNLSDGTRDAVETTYQLKS